MSATRTLNPSRMGVFNRLAGIMNRAAAAVTMRVHVAMANLWRDSYNPLRGLTISRAVSLLEEGERGAYADLQWTYRFIEMQDATLGALIERRTSAIQKLDWNIRVRDDIPQGKELVAARQEAALKDAYGRIGNLSAALEAMVMASFRGFAHLEKVTDADGNIVELSPVEQWFWVRQGIYGAWKLNREAKFGTNHGEEVPLPRFIVREVARPVNRVALIAFIRKNLSQKDWDGFIETYGIPAVFVIMPPDVPSGKEEEYLETADAVVSDARGALPHGSDIKTVDNGARGNNPFKEHLAYQDEQIVMRGTGGLLTMLTQSGSGTLAGNAHAATFEEIAKAEAAEISEVFRHQLDAGILARVTPGEPAYAYFELAANEETDTAAIVKDVRGLAAAGYRVSTSWIAEKTGYQVNESQESGAGALRIPLMNRSRAESVTDWKRFPRESGTLGIPRSVMPQVRNGSRGAMVNFLKARGVTIKAETAKPSDLKPTQAEFSPTKVAAAKEHAGDRAILVSSDNHVIDGHHQYRAALETSPNAPINILRIKSPAMHVLGLLLLMPSTTQEETIRNREDSSGDSESPWAAALATDLQPLGKALEAAMQAGDEAAMHAALRKISEQMPEFLNSSALEEALTSEFIQALTLDDE